MGAKREILNYLQFLQENGFLYVEGLDVEAMFAAPPKKAALSPVSPPPTPPAPVRPVPPVPSRSAAKAQPPAEAPQTDLFGKPEKLPQRRPAAPPLGSSESSGPVEPLGGEDLPRAQRQQRLDVLKAEAEACRACALGATRNKLVFSDGDTEPKIAFVGEAPGGEEDIQGVPFVGRAGQLLTKMIAAIGFERHEIYICNTLKCRPPENRDPLPHEKAACEHFLVAQLEIVRPHLIVALGAHAAQYLCRSELGIGKLRGHWHSYHGIPLLATYHPAFLLRSPSFKAQSWIDFQKIHAKYAELCPDDPRKIWSKEA